MIATDLFWNSLANDLNLVSIGVFLFYMSKVLLNGQKSFRKENHIEIKYQNCKVYPEKYEEKYF